MLGDLRRLLAHLSAKRRWQLLGLLVLMFLGSAAELATLGAVLPFLALLADPTVAFKYPVLHKLFFAFGWRSDNILVPVTILFSLIAVSAAVVRMLLFWYIFRLTLNVGVDLSKELYRIILHQPYSFHVSRNTSEMIAALTKVQSVTSNVIGPLAQGSVATLISLAIVSALVRIDPITAIVAGIGFTSIYAVVTLIARRQLQENSKVIAAAETRRIQAVQEGLGGIRDVLIDGAQTVYVTRFWKTSASQSRAQSANQFIAGAPRYMIESLGMVLIACIAYWLSSHEGGLSAAIPMLGALAVGAQKLMPLMQQIYYSWAAINGNRNNLADVIALLDQPIPEEYFEPSSTDPLPFQRGITLSNLTFRYRQDGPDVIRQLNLKIPRGSRVGFVGKTGTGKSTVIDLIMGLLEPTGGSIEIDGRALTSANQRAWRARIAHVPQSIYLADASLAENIAFGVNPSDIDYVRVREAARKAQLSEFIETLPSGYDALVGERGVRLSGGQRQRIGLARALYKPAQVLFLDEATSALDNATEQSVMESINALGREVTVVMIAHRLSTLQSCDRLFELRQGSLFREGNYEEIILSARETTSPHFS
jgi:ATP-binding cassette, subfamily B, bacterial PglK